jgi:cysteine desulfurase family protein
LAKLTPYFDNPASSHPKPEAVYGAVEHALRLGANPGRAGHRAALDAARLVHGAREAVATLFGVGDCSRIVFTLNATQALNQAIKGLLRPGDHVVTSSMEHNSVVRPLHYMAGQGIEVDFVKADTQGRVDPQKLEDALKPNTKLLVLNHASNVCGTLQDAEAVGALCRRRGVLFLLDAAQTAGCIELDVEKLGVDLLAAPGHKGLLGPQGTGVLYVRPGLALTPLIHGGTGNLSAGRDMPPEMPEALEGGTVNTPGIAGLEAGVRYLLERGVADVRAEELALMEWFLPRLSELKGITVFGPEDPAERVAVVSFNIEGVDSAHLGYELDEQYSIGVRVGLHCAPDAHRSLGSFPQGAIRVGFGPFNTIDDAKLLLNALEELISA